VSAGGSLVAASAPGQRRRPLKRARRWVRYHAARGTLRVLSSAPRRPSLLLFEGLGHLAYVLMPGQRRLVTGQIDRVYAERPVRWRRRLARRAFASIARSAVDVARLGRGARRELLGLVVLPLRERLAPFFSDRGAISIGGHLGAWELVPSVLAALGAPVTVLVRPVREERLDRLVSGLRSAHGAALLRRTNDARAVLRVLRRGQVLAVAADQLPRGRRVRGRLLGLPVELPAGPAALAIAARVPLVPVGVRRAGQRHELLVGEPIEPAARRTVEGMEAMMAAYTERLDEWIRSSPEEWAWFHERWRGEAQHAKS